jgi:hypothetical protein
MRGEDRMQIGIRTWPLRVTTHESIRLLCWFHTGRPYKRCETPGKPSFTMSNPQGMRPAENCIYLRTPGDWWSLGGSNS